MLVVLTEACCNEVNVQIAQRDDFIQKDLLKFRRRILQGFMKKRQVTVSDRSSNSMEMKEKWLRSDKWYTTGLLLYEIDVSVSHTQRRCFGSGMWERISSQNVVVCHFK